MSAGGSSLVSKRAMMRFKPSAWALCCCRISGRHRPTMADLLSVVLLQHHYWDKPWGHRRYHQSRQTFQTLVIAQQRFAQRGAPKDSKIGDDLLISKMTLQISRLCDIELMEDMGVWLKESWLGNGILPLPCSIADRLFQPVLCHHNVR